MRIIPADRLKAGSDSSRTQALKRQRRRCIARNRACAHGLPVVELACLCARGISWQDAERMGGLLAYRAFDVLAEKDPAPITVIDRHVASRVWNNGLSTITR